MGYIVPKAYGCPPLLYADHGGSYNRITTDTYSVKRIILSGIDTLIVVTHTHNDEWQDDSVNETVCRNKMILSKYTGIKQQNRNVMIEKKSLKQAVYIMIGVGFFLHLNSSHQCVRVLIEQRKILGSRHYLHYSRDAKLGIRLRFHFMNTLYLSYKKTDT